MLGREAYHQPWLLADWDARFFGDEPVERDRESVEAAMVGYMERILADGEPWSRVSRHMLGLRNGLPGSRHWRQVWSDHRRRGDSAQTVSRAAAELAAALAGASTTT